MKENYYTSSSLEEECKGSLEDQSEGFGIDDFGAFEDAVEFKNSIKKLTKELDHEDSPTYHFA